MAGSTPNQARWLCSTHRVASAPTASLPRQMASVLRFARWQLSRPDRRRDWQCDRLEAACSASRRSSCLERQSWRSLDHRLDSGDLLRYDSKIKSWAHGHLTGDGPQPCAVYVDEMDAVWVSDWGANAIVRFDTRMETFEAFPLPDRYASVRELAGCKGEVWVRNLASTSFSCSRRSRWIGGEGAWGFIRFLLPLESRRRALTRRPTASTSTCPGNASLKTAGGGRVVIENDGAASTVVWNPWADMAAAMADLGDTVGYDFVNSRMPLERIQIICRKLAQKPGSGDFVVHESNPRGWSARAVACLRQARRTPSLTKLQLEFVQE